MKKTSMTSRYGLIALVVPCEPFSSNFYKVEYISAASGQWNGGCIEDGEGPMSKLKAQKHAVEMRKYWETLEKKRARR